MDSPIKRERLDHTMIQGKLAKKKKKKLANNGKQKVNSYLQP